MPTFTSQRKIFSSQAPAISSLGLRFKNIKPGKTLEDISRSVLSDKLVLTFFISWLFAVLLTFAYVLTFYKDLPLQIPLFYSRPLGEQQLSTASFIFMPVVGTFILGVVSFFAASFQIKENKILAYILSGAAPLVALLVMITTLNIINLVK
jgi:hypothetical protein